MLSQIWDSSVLRCLLAVMMYFIRMFDIFIISISILSKYNIHLDPGKWLCDFWWWAGCANCIMVFPPYLYTEFKSSYKDIECDKLILMIN